MREVASSPGARSSRCRSRLFLDTFAHQDAKLLYERAGWTHAGDIPRFALAPEGTLEATSFYYRLL